MLLIMTRSVGRRRRAVRSAALVAVGAVIVAGCSNSGRGGPTASSTAPYAADIALAKTKATSDFERAVLADGVITAAEYDEATQAYVTCVNGRLPAKFVPGIVAIKNEFGQYGFQGPGLTEAALAEYDSIFQKIGNECEKGTSGIIAPLYNDMIANPNKTDRYTQAVICLKRFKLVPDSYAVKNYIADEVAHGAKPDSGLGSAPNPADATKIAWDSDAVVKCRLNPWGK